jgi:hypothetical protein
VPGKKGVAQPLKPQYGQSTFGTAEAVPLSKSDFPATWEAVRLTKLFQLTLHPAAGGCRIAWSIFFPWLQNRAVKPI